MNKLNKILLSGLGIAFVFILTAFVAFPIGVLGYINIGDAIILLFASIVSPMSAFFIGGIGSIMADFILAPQYAIFTFFIKGMEGALASYFIHRYMHKNYGFWIGGCITVLGYAITDIVLSGQLYMALPSIGFNSIQIIICILIAYIGKPFLYKIGQRYKQ